jgi:AcrR family transcriptional regulator
VTSRATATSDAAGAPETGRERAKRQRTERIIAAARELLHENPDTDFTIPRIAERAGVAPMTIFNLIGNRDDIWAALANDALTNLRSRTGRVPDPHARARKIVDEVIATIISDAPVFRALLAGWSGSGRVLEHEPTNDLIACLDQAATEGQINPDSDTRRLGALIFSGVVGVVHQWAAGLLSDRAMRTRSRDVVDMAFAAARPNHTNSQWAATHHRR